MQPGRPAAGHRGGGPAEEAGEPAVRLRDVEVPGGVLARALAFSLLAGASTYSFWLIFTLARRRWVQAAVITAGVVIPWALHRGAISAGRRRSPTCEVPPAGSLRLALLSSGVMAALLPLALYAAYSVLNLDPNYVAGFGGFLSSQFGVSGTAQVVVGFLLAFGIPFFLDLGVRPPESIPGGDDGR